MLVKPVRQAHGKPSIGIMQSRLTPSKGRGIQFFPFDEWEKEFERSVEIGLNEIDFIFDRPNYEQNPLWSHAGISRVRDLISKTGVRVNSICADLFMRLPPHNWPWTENASLCRFFLSSLTQSAYRVGAKIVEIPLLVDSSLNAAHRRTNFIGFLNLCLSTARYFGVTLAIETDLSPKELLSLASVFNGEVKLVYDIGNSASLGYDPAEEIEMLGGCIINVHIKDRTLGGGTVPLGTGAVDFDAVFSMLAKKSYKGSFIFQAARGEDGKEIETVAEQIVFLRRYLEKYNFV